MAENEMLKAARAKCFFKHVIELAKIGLFEKCATCVALSHETQGRPKLIIKCSYGLHLEGYRMLIKAKKFQGYTLFRRGMGHVFRLMELAHNDTVCAITPALISYYTDMIIPFIDLKRSALIRMFTRHPESMFRLTREVLTFNLPPVETQVGGTTSDAPDRETDSHDRSHTTAENEKLITGYIDILASAYSWTLDYILENIDMIQARELVNAIKEREKGKKIERLYHGAIAASAGMGGGELVKNEIDRMNGIEREVLFDRTGSI